MAPSTDTGQKFPSQEPSNGSRHHRIYVATAGTPRHMSCILGFSTKIWNNSVFPRPFQIFNHPKTVRLPKPNANERKCVLTQVVEKILRSMQI